ncbi:DUF2779 domain-containing protein [Parafrankia sp. BMG5.11]|uniref:DUF2779 domain-containing protein n=1 Tax=Parafrankia sp. BMG5.11 TaxID=222540 RepID=UPI001A9E11FF|nr:DUF2779 domain-containing protein [Parafrankia sp. BMG5.11]
MVLAEPDLAAALERTRELLAAAVPRPIFEATVEHEGVLVRIDILEPRGGGRWHMAEVKSSTRAKEYHVGDLATQLWVADGAGVEVSSASIRHIDNTFVLSEPGNYHGLFVDAVMESSEALAAGRSAIVASARETLAGSEPERETGSHCDDPFPCEFADYCHSGNGVPDWPVTVLPNGGGRRWLERGVADLLEVDPAELKSPLHRRVYDATATGAIFHDRDAACATLAGWEYPRSWLDFETITFAIPRWVGTRPYQQIPFQFSVHVEDEDGSIRHREFLNLDGSDPRRECAEALLAHLPQSGAVIGYNASFEKARILELASCFPDLAQGLQLLASRVVDLLPVARTCWYHREQRGSWSIKAVLPTVAPELDYSALAVGDGQAAQIAYLEAISPATSDLRRRELRVALSDYCCRDTEAMIVLARRLCSSSSSAIPRVATVNSEA